MYKYQKVDYESMKAVALKFAKEKYFNGYSGTRSVQENFNLNTSFIPDSANKNITSKTSRSVSSFPWLTPEKCNSRESKEIRSTKFRTKFGSLRREIKTDIRKQHEWIVNNLLGYVNANPRDFYRYIIVRKKKMFKVPPTPPPPPKMVAENGVSLFDFFLKSDDPILSHLNQFILSVLGQSARGFERRSL